MLAAGLVHGSVSALSAFVVGVLPVAVLWRLRMSRRSKVTVIVLLGMSILCGPPPPGSRLSARVRLTKMPPRSACIALVVRMTTLRSELSLPEFFRSTMYDAALERSRLLLAALPNSQDTAMWSMIESGVGIVAACLPTLRPLLSKLGPRRAGAKQAPAAARAYVAQARAPKPHWHDLTAIDARDGAATDTDAETARVRTRGVTGGDSSTCHVRVERGRCQEWPPPVGISVHTDIEVTSKPRDSAHQGTTSSLAVGDQSTLAEDGDGDPNVGGVKGVMQLDC
ncbi:hypothetical protein CDD83_11152 [Cordyceps sp. RAO-2017]|nr:hypothetical protein CDD83_11152 [Cordyceps sp. RAO-2017]